ncbi:MAG: indole-3-glycerol phosphate synthase TrpC [Armatimonadota bacterium]|nr:indole-3-glycerol phosphate synthase TrpC [Armatimonadota bacterium]MDR7438534.1 indole-3-glycerol phosphate synthase TrpC [Armatimonadota bacterium]MDR7562342.1 indole-3-glycerol phosphate synthase TrpC [Armatimonadota bacterium]MDR7567578.1 indole-3-glycerol phosphate synthase TrpC [Armatimonadota bacterium]MDR7601906.1 indole-3-glycerol phosphate synthase TrpC [Armatimonadota bacterium]
MNLLQEIVRHKRQELAQAQATCPEAEVRARALSAPSTRDFALALRGRGIAVIAELKAASPSVGVIRRELDPVALARAYAAGGADALSVLTDRHFFRGDPEHLRAAREATRLPVLRKDFTLEPYHVYEARALGADAVLLIAAVLDDGRLRELRELAEELGMAAVVEVHTEEEVERALHSKARIIGINNRDLRTFRVDLETTFRLRPRIPDGILVVSESGIEHPEQVRALQAAGVDAVLVGTALLAAPDPEAKLRALRPSYVRG